VDGDKTYVSIAAASILAKTIRDDHMKTVLHPMHPEYGWEKNKGYGTKDHLEAIQTHGACTEHRAKFLSGEGAAGNALRNHHNLLSGGTPLACPPAKA
jgi:ribonuclease HII